MNTNPIELIFGRIFLCFHQEISLASLALLKPTRKWSCIRILVSFENDNLKAYKLLLRIEIVLRECLKDALKSENGLHWQKKLPGELLKKINDSQKEENRPQFNFVRLGPLYYLTFGELLTILRQKSGRYVAEKLGGDSFLQQLENILTPRNALCHSRPISSVGLKTVETLYAEMETALTSDGLKRFLEKPDTGLTQNKAAKDLIYTFSSALDDLSTFPASLPTPEVYQTAILQFWWADDTLAGFNRSSIENTISLIRQYNELPKGVGSAWERQKFCQQRCLKKIIQEAIIELERVIL